jgi:CDP-6-deoxy-D-xylo-4-hexulose-3-dehydrase
MSDKREGKEDRAAILALVRQYWENHHKQTTSFSPGQKLPYSGRIFDGDEMENLVDSALEFWLTYGRYSKNT